MFGLTGVGHSICLSECNGFPTPQIAVQNPLVSERLELSVLYKEYAEDDNIYQQKIKVGAWPRGQGEPSGRGRSLAILYLCLAVPGLRGVDGWGALWSLVHRLAESGTKKTLIQILTLPHGSCILSSSFDVSELWRPQL